MREASLPAKLRAWREKLSGKAKQEKRYRCSSLSGLVSHPATLEAAWNQVRANGGAPGVDGVSLLESIERSAEATLLEQIAKELREKTYRGQPVRRVYIAKANAKKRPLGIPGSKTEWCKRRCSCSSKRSLSRILRIARRGSVPAATRTTPWKPFESNCEQAAGWV
jgi:hypothetical protein